MDARLLKKQRSVIEGQTGLDFTHRLFLFLFPLSVSCLLPVSCDWHILVMLGLGDKAKKLANSQFFHLKIQFTILIDFFTV